MKKQLIFATLLASMFTMSASAEFTLEPQEVASTDGVTITIDGAVDDDWAPQVETTVKNETDKEIVVMAENGSLNGYMIDPMWSTHVAPGETVTDTMEFWDSLYDMTGITDIANVKIQFHVVDSDSWDTLFDTELITLQVPGMEGYEQEYDESGELLYEDDNVMIIAKDFINYYDDAEIVLYAVNKTDKVITLQAREEKVNGIELEGIMSMDITPGDHIIDTLSWSSSDLEENDLTYDTINELEFVVIGFESDSYDDIFETDPINLVWE